MVTIHPWAVRAYVHVHAYLDRYIYIHTHHTHTHTYMKASIMRHVYTCIEAPTWNVTSLRGVGEASAASTFGMELNRKKACNEGFHLYTRPGLRAPALHSNTCYISHLDTHVACHTLIHMLHVTP
jgi:hypothetical protein